MKTVEATRCLREEHRVILKVLECFEIALRSAQESNTISAEVFDPFVTFFQGFADQCHHCKEEGRLFPRLEAAGIPREGGPIGVMLYEHEQGRMHVRAIAENISPAANGDADAMQSVLSHGGAFIDLMRGHIGKEDNVLFSMADQVIDSAGLDMLKKEYEEEESAPDYCKRFDRCRRIADELMEKYGVQHL